MTSNITDRQVVTAFAKDARSAARWGVPVHERMALFSEAMARDDLRAAMRLHDEIIEDRDIEREERLSYVRKTLAGWADAFIMIGLVSGMVLCTVWFR